jgi:hypothetical protein
MDGFNADLRHTRAIVCRCLSIVAEQDLQDLCLVLRDSVDEVLDDPSLLSVVIVAEDRQNSDLSLDIVVGTQEQLALALELLLA